MDDAELDRGTSRVRVIQRAAWSHAVTIRVSEIVDFREHTWQSASGVLLSLGQHLLVATAWHVIQYFVDIRDKGGIPVLVIGNFPIITPVAVHQDEYNDLVLLQMPPDAISSVDAIPYVAEGRWPAKKVKKGDDVLVCGFPSMFRSDADEIEHGDLTFGGEVESVSDSQFILLPFERGTIDLGRVAFPGEDACLGGLSGSPVFGVYDDGMHLVGVFSQGGNAAVPAWIVRSLSHLPADFVGPGISI